MATYIGFSTQHVENVRTAGFTRGINSTIGNVDKFKRADKKFRTVDEELVIRDLLNSFNIIQGQKPGKPEYGTILWSFIFEPNTVDVTKDLEAEIGRIVGLDPRIILNNIQTTQNEYSMLVELELAISPFNNVIQMAVMFDQATKTANLA